MFHSITEDTICIFYPKSEKNIGDRRIFQINPKTFGTLFKIAQFEIKQNSVTHGNLLHLYVHKSTLFTFKWINEQLVITPDKIQEIKKKI